MSPPPQRPLPVRIGVRITSGEQHLADTIRALYETIGSALKLLILADPAPGKENSVAALLKALPYFEHWQAGAPGGAAACFNRLIAQPAAFHVLVEAGAIPGPDWLDRLRDALADDPANGIAGPTLNHAATMHGILSGCAGTRSAIACEAAERAGAGWHMLGPGHSIAAFCIAVSAATVATVGAADTTHGRAPGWEVDYAARATRAGLRSLWVPSAFVWRGHPETSESTPSRPRSVRSYA